MTTVTKRETTNRWQSVETFGFLAVCWLNIGVGHYWPRSLGATIVSYVFFGVFAISFGVRVRAGYLRRKPHWTRESWLHYLRLAVMPVIALALVLYLSSFDMSSNALGAPRSTTRAVVAASLVVTMLVGVVGLIVAMDWMAKGEPSEQFTRTRWFQRRRVPG